MVRDRWAWVTTHVSLLGSGLLGGGSLLRGSSLLLGSWLLGDSGLLWCSGLLLGRGLLGSSTLLLGSGSLLGELGTTGRTCEGVSGLMRMETVYRAA